MADIMPNIDINKKRLKVKLIELQTNIERMELRLMELDEEKSKVLDNMEITKKAIKDLGI